MTASILLGARSSFSLLAYGAALCGLLSEPIAAHADSSTNPPTVQAQFRGCDSAGWCRFWIEALDPLAMSLHRVRPEDVVQLGGGDALVVRNRLNALLSDMIHQAKHIELHNLHELEDGTFSAAVTVNGIDVASDSILVDLRAKLTRSMR